MIIAITAVMTAAAAVFFTADCLGKINRRAEGTGIIYGAAPLLLGVILCVCAGGMGSFAFSGYIDNEENFNTAKELLISCAVAFPAFVISVIGSVRLAVQNGKKREYERFSDGDGLSLITLWQTFSAVGGTVSGAAFVIFAGIAAVRIIGTFGAGVLGVIAAFAALTLLTFGIGIIIAVIVMPAVLIILGFNAIVSCLPLIAAAAVCGAVFFAEHIMTIVFSVSALKKLRSDESVSKKKAVVYGLLSALPGINIFSSAQIRAKVVHNETLF